MASQLPIQFASLAEELEYNGMLYKEIQNVITQMIHANEITDQPCISRLLTTEQMQRIRTTDNTKGQISGARELLDNLRSIPGFFQALLEAVDKPELKLQHCVEELKSKQDIVNKLWLEKRRTSTNNVSRDSAHSKVPHIKRDVTSDFKLQIPVQAHDQRIGYQKDAVLETAAEERQLMVRNFSTITTRELEARSSMEGAAGTQEVYTDAMSSRGDMPASTYATLNNPGQEHNIYRPLISTGSLEADASPDISQPMDDLEISQAEPRAGPPPRARQVQRRQDHPSLRNAISDKPEKDFERNEVASQLSQLPGWIENVEENEVIPIIRPHWHTEGMYVIWYWALAKRPTICAIFNRKVITFVVHKSSRRPPTKYFINKLQHSNPSLRALVEFHRTHGILYQHDNRESGTVPLRSPVPL